jgi:ammonium transporter, Amt family
VPADQSAERSTDPSIPLMRSQRSTLEPEPSLLTSSQAGPQVKPKQLLLSPKSLGLLHALSENKVSATGPDGSGVIPDIAVTLAPVVTLVLTQDPRDIPGDAVRFPLASHISIPRPPLNSVPGGQDGVHVLGSVIVPTHVPAAKPLAAYCIHSPPEHCAGILHVGCVCPWSQCNCVFVQIRSPCVLLVFVTLIRPARHSGMHEAAFITVAGQFPAVKFLGAKLALKNAVKSQFCALTNAGTNRRRAKARTGTMAQTTTWRQEEKMGSFHPSTPVAPQKGNGVEKERERSSDKEQADLQLKGTKTKSRKTPSGLDQAQRVCDLLRQPFGFWHFLRGGHAVPPKKGGGKEEETRKRRQLGVGGGGGPYPACPLSSNHRTSRKTPFKSDQDSRSLSLLFLPEKMSGAEELAALQKQVQQMESDMNTFWLMFAGIVVFFMQAGFSLVEAGSVRMTNVQNILMKNLLDVCMGCIAFWLVGYAFAYGTTTHPDCKDQGDDDFDGETCAGNQDGNAFIGDSNFALWDIKGDWASWFFQFAFAATAATIVSGSMAERTDFRAYLAYTVFLTAFVYPVVVHWGWSSAGWLSAFRQEWVLVNETAPAMGVEQKTKPLLGDVGFIDFAGSGIVHMVGGVAGLVGTMVLGPRLGRFKDGKVQELRSHNLVLSSLGVWILWFGWYGFNPGSTLAIVGASEVASRAAVTTTISAAFAGISTMLLAYGHSKVWNLQASLNGVLGGLVSITSGCATVDPWAAMLIGILGGGVYYGSSLLLLKFEIDDPVDAAPVHLFCGAWGVVSAGLFSSKKLVESAYGVDDPNDYGLFVGGHINQLGVQFLALFVILAWTSVLMALLFLALKYFKMLRIDSATEFEGIDAKKHGGAVYAFDKIDAPSTSDPSIDNGSSSERTDTSSGSSSSGSSSSSVEISVEEDTSRSRRRKK